MRTWPALVLAVAVTSAFAAFGCRGGSKPSPSPSASASAGPNARARNAPRPSASVVAPPPAPIGCRVLSAKGGAPGAPKLGDLLEGTAFFDLPAGAELSLRHSETTRELALLGPGRFRVCPKGEELVVVTRGKVKTTAGPGARAGAEVRLATPFGIVHFGDAALGLEVTDKQADLRVGEGTATIDGRAEADGPTPKPVSGPKGRATFRGRTDPALLEPDCLKYAGALVAPRPAASAAAGASLGQWAVERLKARQATRHVCTRAMAVAGLVEGSGGDRLWDLAASKIVATGSGPVAGAPEK